MKALCFADRAESMTVAQQRELVSSLTPQEHSLFTQALAKLSSRVELEATAQRLDAGGEWMNEQQAICSQRMAVQQANEMEEKMEGADQGQITTLGVDDVSAGHVCCAELSTLVRVGVAQLRQGISRGVYLEGTIEEPVYYIASVSALLRDEGGALVSISLHNFVQHGASQASIRRAFPAGSRVIVREPYMKVFNSGYLGLRVDNPCNVTLLPPDAMARDADALKAFGNERFADRDVWGAARAYTQALTLQPAPPADLQAVLLSNRALVRLGLRDAGGALEDCEAGLALAPAPALARKLALRRIKALLHLHRFQEARAATEAAAAPAQGAAQLQLLVRTAEQQASGRYDALTLPHVPGAPQADVQPFVGPVQVRQAGQGKGRGLFATRPVAAGELLLVERALGVRYTDCSRELTVARKVNKASQHQLISDLVLSAQCGSSLLNRQLGLLFTGQPGAPVFDAQSAGRDARPAAPVSALAVRHAVCLNTFLAYEATREPSPRVRQALQRCGAYALQAPQPPLPGGYSVEFNPSNAIKLACLPLDSWSRGASRAQALAQAVSGTPADRRAVQVNAGAEEGGATALMLAAAFGDAEAVKVLLLAGADARLTDRHGLTALHSACGARGGQAIIALLVEAGADVNCATPLGTTPLCTAISRGCAEAATELLRRGADVHAEDGLTTKLALAVLGAVAEKELLQQCCREAGRAAPAPARSGAGLWCITSLMNHPSSGQGPSSYNTFCGEWVMVRSKTKLEAGEEITTSYSDGDLTQWGINR